MKPLDQVKQKIVSNIDNLRGMLLSFKKEEIEDALNKGHLFQYKVDRLRDDEGKEYTILASLTITQDNKVKERPLFKIRG